MTEAESSASTMAESQQNLKTLFAAANNLRKQLESLQTTTQQYQDSLRTAISTFEECHDLATRISLFSPNETEDDIASADFQYLSIDYYLGDLITRNIHGDRKEILHSSQQAYSRFLNLLDTYELLSPSDRKLYERFSNDKDSFSLITSSDASARRETKIARFQQEKELKQKLEVPSSTPSLIPQKNLHPPYSTCLTTPAPCSTTTPPSATSTAPSSRSTRTRPSTP